MKRVRQFLSPGWILAFVVAIAFSYLAFTVLAPWQLGKNERTQERIHQLQESFEIDPVPAQELFTDGAIDPAKEWRRVTVTGDFIPNAEVHLRNRPVNGGPAIQLLAVFRADDGQLYLVNRGFVVPSDSNVVEVDPPPSGQITISGFARIDEPAPGSAPKFEVAGEKTVPQVYGINTEQIADVLAQYTADSDIEDFAGLSADWIQLDEHSPGVENAIPLPNLDSGPYLSYGIQWIAFGIIIPLAVIWFVYAEIKERRREREEQQLLACENQTPAEDEQERSDSAEGAEDAPAEESPKPEIDAAERARQRRLAQRYGNSDHRFRR